MNPGRYELTRNVKAPHHHGSYSYDWRYAHEVFKAGMQFYLRPEFHAHAPDQVACLLLIAKSSCSPDHTIRLAPDGKRWRESALNCSMQNTSKVLVPHLRYVDDELGVETPSQRLKRVLTALDGYGLFNGDHTEEGSKLDALKIEAREIVEGLNK